MKLNSASKKKHPLLQFYMLIKGFLFKIILRIYILNQNQFINTLKQIYIISIFGIKAPKSDITFAY